MSSFFSSKNLQLGCAMTIALAFATMLFGIFPKVYSSFADDYTPYYEPSRERCREVKQLLDETPDWTARFGSIEEPAKCKRLYYNYNWTEVERSVVYPLEKCAEIKTKWDEGNWTARFGSTMEPADCKNLYYEMKWSSQWSPYYGLDIRISDLVTKNTICPGSSESDPNGCKLDGAVVRLEALNHWNNYVSEVVVNSGTQIDLGEALQNSPWVKFKKVPIWYKGKNYEADDGFYQLTVSKEGYGTKIGLVGIFGSTGGDLYWGRKSIGNYVWLEKNTSTENYVPQYEPSRERCREVKQLLDAHQSDWTPRFGSIEEPAKCKALYYDSGWREVSQSVVYPRTRCADIKARWDEGNWTARFGNTFDPANCKNLYYQNNWDNEPTVNYIPQYEPSRERCRLIKKMFFDPRGWTPRFGNPVEPAKCKSLYYNVDWTEVPQSVVYTPEKCAEIKARWDEGNWTPRFGDTTDPANCKNLYYQNNWNNEGLPTENYVPQYEPSRERCREVKKLLDATPNWTARFGSIEEPSKCKRLYYSYSGWREVEQSEVYPPEKCAEIKAKWDAGNWTARFGNTIEPADCKNLYYRNNWTNGNGNTSWTSQCMNTVTDLWGRYTIELLGKDGKRTADCRFVNFGYDIISGTADLIGMNEYALIFDATKKGKIRVTTHESTYYWAEFDIGGTPPCTNRVTDLSGKFSIELLGNNGQRHADCRFSEYTYDVLSGEAKLIEMNEYTLTFDSTKKGRIRVVTTAPTHYWAEFEIGNSSETSKGIPPAGYEDKVITAFDVYDNPFPDTDITVLAGQAAAELYRRAIIGGYPDGEFKGEKPVNRAELAKFFLFARYGTVDDTSNNGQFPDVLENQWYVRFVVTAAKLGIINGYPDGLFRPGNTVIRAEFLKMIAKTFDIESGLSYSYFDVTSADWFAEYAGIAQKYELFPGEDNFLAPGQEMSRYEVAVAIFQYLKNR
ncbi:S-layer homology domain-containing protein [Candidatus Peregrinibacteria bacterium]|nr:S-layer homology domain-containing protein [Candidatus Peregrinibacteria bacterium]